MKTIGKTHLPGKEKRERRHKLPISAMKEGITAPVDVKREKALAPTPVLLPGKSRGRRSLVGCSPWGR